MASLETSRFEKKSKEILAGAGKHTWLYVDRAAFYILRKQL